MAQNTVFSFAYMLLSMSELLAFNLALSVLLKFFSLVSFTIYFILIYPRIKTRIKGMQKTKKQDDSERI